MYMYVSGATLLGHVALVRGVAGYSHQTFPWTICWSVRRSVDACVSASVCPVHCGKTTDRIMMPFGILYARSYLVPYCSSILWPGMIHESFHNVQNIL